MVRLLVVVAFFALAADPAFAQTMRAPPNFEVTVVTMESDPPAKGSKTHWIYMWGYLYNSRLPSNFGKVDLKAQAKVDVYMTNDFGSKATITILQQGLHPDKYSALITIKHLGGLFSDDANFTWKMKVQGAESRETPFTVRGNEATIPISGGGWDFLLKVKVKPRPTALANAVKAEFKDKKYWLVPDHFNPLIWYYIPEKLELAQRTFGGKSWPDLSLISCQREDNGVLQESAELQFAVKTEDEAQVADGLAQQLRFESNALRNLGLGKEVKPAKNDPLFPLSDVRALKRVKELWKAQVILPLQVKPFRMLSSQIAIELPNLRGPGKDKVLLAAANLDTISLSKHTTKANMGKFSAVLSMEEAKFVEDQLVKGAGLTCRLSSLIDIQYQEWTGNYAKRTKRPGQNDLVSFEDHAVPEIDAFALVNDWLELAATRPELSAAEHQLVKEIVRQYDWAVQHGYAPKFDLEVKNWAVLRKTPLDKKLTHSPIDQNHLNTVALAAKYLLWIYDPQRTAPNQESTAGQRIRRQELRDRIAKSPSRRPLFLNFLGHFPQNNYGLAPPFGTNKASGFANAEEQERILASFEGHLNHLNTGFQEKFSMFEHQGFVKLDAAPAVRNRLILTTQKNKPALLVLDTGEDPTMGLGMTAIDIKPRMEFASSTATQKQFAKQLKDRLDKAGTPVGDFFYPLGVRSETDKTIIDFTPVRWTKAGGWQRQQGAKWLPLNGPGLQFLLGSSANLGDELSKQGLLDARFILDHAAPHPSDAHTLTSVKNGGAFVDHKAKPIEFTVDLPVFKGNRLVPSLAKNLDVIRVDGRLLDWNQLNPTATLRAIEVKLRQGNRLASLTLEPQKTASGIFRLPEEIQWLIRPELAEHGQISPEIIFVQADGSRSAWRLNGDPETFHQRYPNLEVTLLTSDVQGATRLPKK